MKTPEWVVKKYGLAPTEVLWNADHVSVREGSARKVGPCAWALSPGFYVTALYGVGCCNVLVHASGAYTSF